MVTLTTKSTSMETSDVNDDDDMDDVPEGKRQCRSDSLFKAHLKQSVFALG